MSHGSGPPVRFVLLTKSGSRAPAVPLMEKLAVITTVSFSFISEAFPGLVLVGAVLSVGAEVATGRSVTLRLRLTFGIDDIFAFSTDVLFPVVIPAVVDVSTSSWDVFLSLDDVDFFVVLADVSSGLGDVLALGVVFLVLDICFAGIAFAGGAMVVTFLPGLTVVVIIVTFPAATVVFDGCGALEAFVWTVHWPALEEEQQDSGS